MSYVTVRARRLPVCCLILAWLVLAGCATTSGASSSRTTRGDVIEAAERARITSRAAYGGLAAEEATTAETAAAAAWRAYEIVRARAFDAGVLARSDITFLRERDALVGRFRERLSTLPMAGSDENAPDRSYVFLWEGGDETPTGIAVYSWPEVHDDAVAEVKRLLERR